MVEIDAGGKELGKINAEIKEALAKGEAVVVKNAEKSYGLASGLRSGTIRVMGNVNDYVGTVNSGASIVIEGNAGNYLGDNMTSGKIAVSGNAGNGAGIYCYGGRVSVKGNAGDFTGTMNKGATIIVGGDVGSDVGTYMVDGEIIILGNAGSNFGNYLIRGSIYLVGEVESLGNNMKETTPNEDDISKLKKILNEEGFKADPSKMKKFIPKTDKPFYKAKEVIEIEEG